MIAFELPNIVSLFQNFINNILYKILGKFYTTNIENILIYNNLKKEESINIQKLFTVLKKVRLQVDLKKFQLYVIEIDYLQLIISTKGISIELKKNKAIPNYKTLS